MPVQDKIKRYALILEKISKSKYPSFEDIQHFLLKQDFPVSHRTMQRDIEQIKYQLNISIEYDRNRNGYYIENIQYSQNIIDLMQQKSFYADLMEFTQQNPKHKEAILLDNDVQQKGFEYTQEILSAIKQQRKIEFEYQKFREEKPKKYTIEPYALKEYDNRWYLVGLLPGTADLRKFGVDRIQQLEVTTTKFPRNKTIETREHFARMIGINDEQKKREIIHLAFSTFQSKYVEALPLHWSQKEIEKDEDWTTFEYFLIPNYELEQKILALGAEVKILKPIKLRNRIRNVLQQILKYY